MRAKQESFIPRVDPQYGGALVKGKRKTFRPIATTGGAMHIILKSSRARGNWSMLAPRNRKKIEDLAHKAARKHGIRLYRFANVGNHLHLLVKTRTRTAFQRFLKDLAGNVAILITGAKNSNPLKAKFWDQPAYTRIVTFGRDYDNLEQYFIKNLFEAAGLLTGKAKALGLEVIPIVGWVRSPEAKKTAS